MLLPLTSIWARSIWHVICRSIFCSCDSLFGMTQFTCILTGLSRLEYGPLICCKDRPSGLLGLTHAVWEKYTEIMCKINSSAFAASLDSVSVLTKDTFVYPAPSQASPFLNLHWPLTWPNSFHHLLLQCISTWCYPCFPVDTLHTFRNSPLATTMHSLVSLRAVGLLLLHVKFVRVCSGSYFIRPKYEHVYNKERHGIWGLHRDNYKENCVLGYGVVQNGRN
jgi:hypothetical protein